MFAQPVQLHPRLKFTLVLCVYLLLALALSFAAPLTVVNDFTPRYVGVQSALSGESLYSQTTTERIQQVYYGYTTITQDQQAFAYPATSALVFAPITALPLMPAAEYWRGAQLVLACVALFLLVRRWYAPPLLLLLLHEPLVGFLLAQTVLWSVAWLAFGLYALERGWRVRAGVCCALATIQPTLTIPIILILLIRQRRALAAFFAVMLLWALASILVFGWWLPDWLRGVSAYGGYVEFLVWLPGRVWWVAPIGLGLLLLALREKRAAERLGLAAAGTVLLLPMTGLYHLSLFAPAVCRLRWQFWVLFALAAWGLILLPFEFRVWEAALLAGAVALAIFWGRQHWLAPEVQPGEAV